MKLSRNSQIILSVIFTGSLITGGAGFAEAKATESKYQEQCKQMELYKQENTSIQAKYECIQVERDQLQKEVDELSKWKSLGQFVITYYWPGEDQYGKLTSTGSIAQEGKTIAVDPTVIPYGSTIKINGNEYLAEDCGGAIKGSKIDIFVENPKRQKQSVEIYIKEK